MHEMLKVNNEVEFLPQIEIRHQLSLFW